MRDCTRRIAASRPARRAGLTVVLVGVLGGLGCSQQFIIDPGFGERYAAEKNRPMLLYFKLWDSSQHRNMIRDVFNNGAVKSELKSTVNIELEFGFFKEYRAKYGVLRPQVCVLCTSKGEKVGTPMYVSPVPAPEKFLEWYKEQRALALEKAGDAKK